MKKNDSYLFTILKYAELPPSKISIETFQGIVVFTILDKNIFPRNKDISTFIKTIFNIEFKEYVYNTRTLIVARVIRHINKMTKDDIHSLKVIFFEYFKLKNNINDKSDLSKLLQGLGGN